MILLGLLLLIPVAIVGIIAVAVLLKFVVVFLWNAFSIILSVAFFGVFALALTFGIMYCSDLILK